MEVQKRKRLPWAGQSGKATKKRRKDFKWGLKDELRFRKQSYLSVIKSKV